MDKSKYLNSQILLPLAIFIGIGSLSLINFKYSQQDPSLASLKKTRKSLQKYEDLFINKARYAKDLKKLKALLNKQESKALKVSQVEESHRIVLELLQKFLGDTEPNILMNYTFHQEKSQNKMQSIIFLDIEFLCETPVFIDMIKAIETSSFDIHIHLLDIENKHPRGFYGTMTLHILVNLLSSQSQNKEPSS